MNCLTRRQDNPLYVILPYFNYCGFKSRRRLFIECVRRLEKTPGIRIVISEALGPAPLPRMCLNGEQFRFNIRDKIWIKESLINMVVPKLPADWLNIAWIDADLTFLNADWVKDTVKQLKTNEVVQLFQTVINLGPKGECLKMDKGFGYMHKESGTPYVTNDKYGFWHPGYAWACSRWAWEKMGGLVDWAILGSADRHMAMAWIKRSKDSYPGNINKKYKMLLDVFEARCKNFRLSYTPGTVIHHWHGSLTNRRYKERWQILSKYNFDPTEDLETDANGLTCLSTKGQRLAKDILEYFAERKEDESCVQEARPRPQESSCPNSSETPKKLSDAPNNSRIRIWPTPVKRTVQSTIGKLT